MTIKGLRKLPANSTGPGQGVRSPKQRVQAEKRAKGRTLLNAYRQMENKIRSNSGKRKKVGRGVGVELKEEQLLTQENEDVSPGSRAAEILRKGHSRWQPTD